MTHYECTEAAYSLYDGGYRATDRDEIKREYDLTDEELKFVLYAINDCDPKWDKDGWSEKYNVYKSRYYAKKAARGDEVAVKVEGGYILMDVFYYYQIWKPNLDLGK